MTENIQHIRLINGEEIVADIISETEWTITVDTPLMIEERRDESGASALIMTKYIPFSTDNRCELSKEHIITFSQLHPELIKYYKNSIVFNGKSTAKIVAEIGRVNALMEEIMMEEEFDHSGLEEEHIIKGTTSKH